MSVAVTVAFGGGNRAVEVDPANEEAKAAETWPQYAKGSIATRRVVTSIVVVVRRQTCRQALGAIFRISGK